eukprot:564883-Pyramimonas_sp.AAC.1
MLQFQGAESVASMPSNPLNAAARGRGRRVWACVLQLVGATVWLRYASVTKCNIVKIAGHACSLVQ